MLTKDNLRNLEVHRHNTLSMSTQAPLSSEKKGRIGSQGESSVTRNKSKHRMSSESYLGESYGQGVKEIKSKEMALY